MITDMEQAVVCTQDALEMADLFEACQADLTDENTETDSFGLPFEAMDTYSDDPLEFEELSVKLWHVLYEIYNISLLVNKLSPSYLTLCRHLERDIRQMGSLCVTKAVLEQKNCDFPALSGMTVEELYRMVSRHFRKCFAAFEIQRMESSNYDTNMMDWVCRWALLAERLKSTEDKIRKITSGKINADRLLEQAQVFRGDSHREKPDRDPDEIRKPASLPVLRSYAGELVRQKKEQEQQTRKEIRDREKAARRKGPYSGYRAMPVYPAIPIPVSPESGESIRSELIEEALRRGDQETAREIETESHEALGQRWLRYRTEHQACMRLPSEPPCRSGPTDEVRKKLRVQRKKKKKR